MFPLSVKIASITQIMSQPRIYFLNFVHYVFEAHICLLYLKVKDLRKKILNFFELEKKSRRLKYRVNSVKMIEMKQVLEIKYLFLIEYIAFVFLQGILDHTACISTYSFI